MSENLQQEQINEAAARLADYIYRRTVCSKVTGRKALLRESELALDEAMLDALLANVGSEDAHSALVELAIVKGKKDTYVYWAPIMTQQYAKLDALLEDKDILATIASVVRSDSKLYPRPTPVEKLKRYPFNYTEDEILGAAARMKMEEKYEDIGMIQASNGSRALHSSKSLSKAYAQALYEASEVQERENP